jgi:hypothetical protein
MPLRDKLPKSPTVFTRNTSVIIKFATGREILWDNEETIEKAESLAKELEVELRAVKYIQSQVHGFITEMREYLASLDINDKLLDSILIDGHAFARMDLDKDTVNTIIMGAERGLRKEILENLASDTYIV